MSLAGETVQAERRTLWTPTWTSVTQGTSAINEGWYLERSDGLVDFRFRLQFGTTPSFSATIRLTLPSEAWTGSGSEIQSQIGWWGFRNSSDPYHYSGTLGIWATDGLDVSFGGAWDGTAPRSRITNGVPFTVADDDILSGGGTYLPAANA